MVPKKNEKKVSPSTDEKVEKSPDYEVLFLRVTADFQNYKKRVEKERIQWYEDAQIDVLGKMLAILDDLDRAVDSYKKQDGDGKNVSDGVLKGLELVQKNAHKIFKDLGVEEIDCSGQFSPDLHEALLEVDSKEHASGDIVDVINKGYALRSRVVRHAKVSVAK